MAYTPPGQYRRQGISMFELFRMFPTNEVAEQWFIQQRWGDEIACVRCGSCNVNAKTAHKSMPHRCRDCDKRFSVRLGTAMEASKLSCQIWAMATYLMMTGIKGVSSMKLHRDLEITQKTAWFLAHRIRESWNNKNDWLASEMKFSGPVECDETYIGGKEANKHANKKLNAGGGTVGKTAVVGAKDRKTRKVKAQVVNNVDALHLTAFVSKSVKPGSTVYTDENRSYAPIAGRYEHETVNHSAGEYVTGEAHVNGVEGFWSMFKRGFYGTYHKMSKKHLDRYVNEFTGRGNVRDLDTLKQMESAVQGMEGKRLRYVDLIAKIA